MALKIEDYALIGDTHTAALVGRDGSIDWFCVPRFDSPAVFAKLLGDSRHGYWRICPTGCVEGDPDHPIMATRRSYRGHSLVLDTEWTLPEGTVRVTDCMPVREEHPEIVRVVEGISGRVELSLDLVIRFGYGNVVPWVRRVDGLLTAIAGPDGLALWSPVHTHGEGLSTVATSGSPRASVCPSCSPGTRRTSRRPARSTGTTASRTPRSGGPTGPRWRPSPTASGAMRSSARRSPSRRSPMRRRAASWPR